MASVFTVVAAPRLDNSFITITKIATAETVAGGVTVKPENVGLAEITFAFGFMVGSTEENEAGPKTSIPGIWLNNKLLFYDTATGKELVTGKTVNKGTVYVIAFGPTRLN